MPAFDRAPVVTSNRSGCYYLLLSLECHFDRFVDILWTGVDELELRRGRCFPSFSFVEFGENSNVSARVWVLLRGTKR